MSVWYDVPRAKLVGCGGPWGCEGASLVFFADHLANAGLPLALLVARDPPVLATRLLIPLALLPQVLHNLLFCDLHAVDLYLLTTFPNKHRSLLSPQSQPR